ncbi:MAG: class I SAM-dependent methyltransferase, partial [Gammaproteobacteria bacterium]
NNGHVAHFVVGDAFHMSFEDNKYGVCVSIGLFEHFDDVGELLREQLRVLAPGGVLLAYIVPERPDNVQRYFRWLVAMLKGIAHLLGSKKKNGNAKAAVYRNGLVSGAYLTELARLGVTEVESFGMYPLPMVSHSPEFPFSLLPAPMERLLVMVFSAVLGLRKIMLGNDPWTCREELGQAFLVAGRKPQ